MTSFPMPRELPPEPKPDVLELLIVDQGGPELYTFSTEDTIVRSFDEPWTNHGYVWHKPRGAGRPKFFWQQRGLGDYLISAGFVEMHSAEPIDVEKRLYVGYIARHGEDNSR